MKPRLVLLPALAAVLAASPLLGTASAAGPAPQLMDIAGDANGLNTQGQGTLPESTATPVGSQSYADVLSVTWTPMTTVIKKQKKTKTVVTGFTVTTVLSAPPVAPAGTIVVYRMLGDVNKDHKKYLGPVYYTTASGGQPQSALRENLDGVSKLIPLALPTITGSTMTWTVPLTALPKQFTVGDSVTNLYFEVKEIEDFRGQKVPDQVPTYGGASGLGAGFIDVGASTATFKIG